MLPIVIPLSSDNPELRYTLRSIETFYGTPEITLVGFKPKWIKNVNYLSFTEPVLQCRNKNVMQKLLLAAQTLNQDFIRWSDDIFALKPVSSVPYYSEGTMWSTSERCGRLHQKFRLAVNNTMKKVGPHAPFFDVHTPCPIHHESYKDFCSETSWEGYNTHVLRSYYYNHIGAVPTYFPDLKLAKDRTPSELTELCKERLFVSVGDDLVRGGIKSWLDQLFANPSVWESR